MSSVVVRRSDGGPGCLVQLLWFLFIGWWVGQLWIVVAWLAMVTIVFIPLGVKMMNKIPQVVALRNPTGKEHTVTVAEGMAVISEGRETPQRNIILRAVYFLLVGWWLSAIWVELAYLACLTIIGLPLGFVMFDKVPALVSLRR